MPSQITLKSTGMKVTCNFINDHTWNTVYSQISLFHGRHETIANYVFYKRTYEILYDDRISVKASLTTTNISLTFVFSDITCSDFSTYKCRGYETAVTGVDSEEKILKSKHLSNNCMRLKSLTNLCMYLINLGNGCICIKNLRNFVHVYNEVKKYFYLHKEF